MHYIHLNIHHRIFIELQLRRGASQASIARALNVHRSTISNELKRNRVKGYYSAKFAQALANERAGMKNGRQLVRPTKRDDQSAHRLPQLERRKNGRVYEQFYRRWRLKFEIRLNKRNRYQWNPRFQAVCRRQWYLSKRRRNHGLEALSRSRRTTYSVLRRRSYRGPVRLRPRAPYIRRYVNTPLGIIKGHYRDRGFWSVRGLKKEKGNALPHLRYMIQNPVHRMPVRKRIRSNFYGSKPASFSKHYKKSTFDKLISQHKHSLFFKSFSVAAENVGELSPTRDEVCLMRSYSPIKQEKYGEIKNPTVRQA